ncbi:MAG: MFS transporter [Lentisphaeria bacterium]|nr:MFS transporter [Lentisphaeria bacterium]
MDNKNQKKYYCGTLVYTVSSLVVLFIWLLGGDFAWAMKDRAIVPAATLLIRQFGVSDLVYSLIIISFPNFTNIFLTPIISYISDRHRGRFGRRIPFLAFTTPFIVAGSIGLGFVPMLAKFFSENFTQISYNSWALIWFGLFWIFMDFGTTLSGALSGALINDVVPQELLGRFYGLFRAVSLLAGMIFNWYLMGLIESYYLYIFTGVGVLYGVGLTMLCLKVKEGEYPSLEENFAGQNKSGNIFKPIFIYFKQCFSHPYYLLVMVALTLSCFISVPYNMYAILYAKELNVDMDIYGKICASIYLLSFIVSFPLGILADKFHPLRTSIVGAIFYLFSMIAGLIFVRDAKSFLIILALHTFLSGCYFTVSASLPQRLFPRALFAQFNSAFGMILALGNTLFGMLFGFILDSSNRNYKLVFVFAIVVIIGAISALLAVLKKFKLLGGDQNYNPPLPSQK